MAEGTLVVKVLATKGKKTYDVIVTDKIADATITSPYLVMSDDQLIIGTDNFQRVTSHSVAATIEYAKGRSEVRGGEKKQQDILDLSTFVSTSMLNPKIAMKGTGIMSYASPEGEIDKNAALADDRAGSAQTFTTAMMKKLKYEAGQAEGFYKLDPKGEDWAGFEAEVKKTSHPDKDLILRVLQMTSDLNKREEEIRNMAKTYTFLEKEVLPQLRRSQMTLSYDLTGKSDEELLAWAASKADSLTIEELLFTANTLVTDENDRLRLYGVAEGNSAFAGDWRPSNNAGYILMGQNKVDEAAAKFEKSNGIQNNPVATNNLGVIARLKGDRNKASELFAEASSAGPEVAYNQGIIAIQNGNYEAAISKMGSNKTFNMALAKMLNGDTDGALSTLDASSDADSAMGYYLKAIIGARTGNNDMMINNLKSAVGKDASLKGKAAKDREFIKHFADAAFTGVVG
jgi:Flp pilus assembly protein TadD